MFRFQYLWNIYGSGGYPATYHGIQTTPHFPSMKYQPMLFQTSVREKTSPPVIMKSLISRGHLGMEPLGLCMLVSDG